MSQLTTDDKYYQAISPGGLSERVFVLARNKIYQDFIEWCRPTVSSKILDVGVSDVVNTAANILEWRYPHRNMITAVGLGEAGDFKATFPDVKYVQVKTGLSLPFEDRSFDLVTSNAVLEHLGSPSNQKAFLEELFRVGSNVYVTVPNRYFPIEHHTAIPLLHYSDAAFGLSCRLAGKKEWSEPKNLILMSKRTLKALAPDGGSAQLGYTGLRLGPLSSNLILYLRR